jgi:hypothetical protein
MAEKEYYLGDSGPYYYDTESAAGLSVSQLVTREELLSTVDLSEGQRDILSALLLLVDNGILVRKDSGFVSREILGTANQVVVTNSDGYNGDITISLSSEIDVQKVITDQLDLQNTVYVSAATATHKVPLLINNVLYYILLTNV